jgi:predicted helicase
MTISEYVSNIDERFKTGISREHSYRADLQNLLDELLEDVLVTNEPARIECGAPDYIITKKSIPVGYIEAKDIGEPLKGKKHKEQFDRYKESLPNLIITDYLDFHLYREGEFVTSVSIADIDGDSIEPKSDNFKQFKDVITDFATHTSQTITSSAKLSKMMAGKARLLSNIIEKALNKDKQEEGSSSADSSLRDQLEAFQNVLIHDIDAKEFADIYAQTIAYGMFAARLHDPTLDSFSRQEAAQLIPKTNPFLRKLFQYIAGYDLDERIDWVVDALADIFRATDVAALLKDFGKSTQQTDPIIHFYETFLAEFDPSLRKSRGVWYTPEPVVNFIVRAVDDILKDEFNLSDGLADTSKTTVKVNTDVKDGRSSTGYRQEEKEVHKVQILDPAAGTGTFLAEVINQIHEKFEGQEGIWASYVENHLIPRLNGFEILMASYAMAHLKLDMLLRETGYLRESDQRFRVYLTNSLEEHHPDTGTLFASWLSEEANQANHVKRDTPVMAVLGNPPYSGISSNMGDWITELIEDYKYIDGEHFGERKHWLHDDYVKFIRFGQHFIDKNGEGVLAFINNHGFLDNPTFRGMRWSLLNSFDEIYVLDLHGNSLKKEKNPDGGKDENVFDIQAGVSINIFIKNNDSSDLAEVYHKELWGSRHSKYNALRNSEFDKVNYTQVEPTHPYYFFIPSNNVYRKVYQRGFKVNELMSTNVTGVVTARDNAVLSFEEKKLVDRMDKFTNFEYSDQEIRNWMFPNRRSGKYPAGDSRGWKLSTAREEVKNNNHASFIKDFLYRPFDFRKIYYSENMVDWGRESVMYNFEGKENVGLIVPKINKEDRCVYITDKISGHKTASAYDSNTIFPLYLYPTQNDQKTIDDKPVRTPNLNSEIVEKIADEIGLTFTLEKVNEQNTFSPIDILDYIYAILHSPSYNAKYEEFLKIDYPRVPYPKDPEIFWQLVELGGKLRKVHLLEHPVVNDFISTYPIEGNNEITKRLTKTNPGFISYTEEDDEPIVSGEDSRYPNEELGKIQINDEQYFGRVPKKAWNFPIGGYEPAEKWLKDRRDRTLSFEEIQHFQKIIVALMETDRIMQEIDKIDIEG